MKDRDYRTIVKMVEYCDDVASFLNEFSETSKRIAPTFERDMLAICALFKSGNLSGDFQTS